MTRKLAFCVCKNVRTLFAISGIREGSPEKAIYLATSTVTKEDKGYVIKRYTDVARGQQERVKCSPWTLSYIIEDWESHLHVAELRAIMNAHLNTYVVYDYILYDLERLLYIRGTLLTLQWREEYLGIDFIRSVTYQALLGLQFLHGREIQHRNLQSSALLIDGAGTVKIGNLESAWAPSKQHYVTKAKFMPSHVVVPLWNMAPEVLLQHRFKSIEMSLAADMWALGCIVLEMAYVKQKPVFQSPNQVDSPMKYHIPADVKFVLKGMTMLLGTPEFVDLPVDVIPELNKILTEDGQTTSKQLSKLSDWCTMYLRGCLPAYELLSKLLVYAPWNRITAKNAVQMLWFNDLRSRPKSEVLKYVQEELDMNYMPLPTWAPAERRVDETLKKPQNDSSFYGTARIDGMPLRFDLQYIGQLEREAESKKRPRKQTNTPPKRIKRDREGIPAVAPVSPKKPKVESSP